MNLRVLDRCLRYMTMGVLATLLVVACSSSDDDDNSADQTDATEQTAPADQTDTKEEPEEPKDYDVTGLWMMPNKPPLMALKQSKTAVRGDITELQGSGFDPCTAKVVGTIQGDQIEFDEIFICPDNPELEFTVHKSGKMLSEDHMRLTAVDGPHPGTQNWYRQ